MAGWNYRDPRPFYSITVDQKLSFLEDCFPQKNKFIGGDLNYDYDKAAVKVETIKPLVVTRVAENPKVQTIELKVNLWCSKCERKVEKALQGVAGIDMVAFDQENDIVMVRGTMKPDVVLKKVKKVKSGAMLVATSKT